MCGQQDSVRSKDVAFIPHLIKWNKLLMHTIGINLKHIMLREKSQIKKKKSTCLITFYVVREWTKLTYSERNRNSGCLWWVVWVVSKGALGIFLEWRQCSALDRVVGYTFLYIKIPWNEHVAWCTHIVTDPPAQLVGRVGAAPPAITESSLDFSES